MNIYQLPQKYFSSMIEGGSPVEASVKSNEKKESKTKQEVRAKKTAEKTQKFYDGLKAEELSDKKIQGVQSSLDKANAQVKTAENTYKDRYKSLNDLKNTKINIIKGKFATYSQEILGKLVKETLTTKKLTKLTPELTHALKKQAESDAKSKIDGMISKVNTEIQNKIVQANNTRLAFIKTRNTLSTKLDKTMLAKGKYDKDAQIVKAKEKKDYDNAAINIVKKNEIAFDSKQNLSDKYVDKSQKQLDEKKRYLKLVEADYYKEKANLDQSYYSKAPDKDVQVAKYTHNVNVQGDHLVALRKEISTLQNEIAWAKKAKQIRQARINPSSGMPSFAKDLNNKVS